MPWRAVETCCGALRKGMVEWSPWSQTNEADDGAGFHLIEIINQYTWRSGTLSSISLHNGVTDLESSQQAIVAGLYPGITKADVTSVEPTCKFAMKQRIYNLKKLEDFGIPECSRSSHFEMTEYTFFSLWSNFIVVLYLNFPTLSLKMSVSIYSKILCWFGLS